MTYLEGFDLAVKRLGLEGQRVYVRWDAQIV